MKKDFFKVMQVKDAIELLCQAPVLSPVTLPLDMAFGHVLGDDIISPEFLPLAARSAMDGYAVVAEDTFGAGENTPAYINCIADVRIDARPDFKIGRGECARVVTGSLIPEGATAILMVEYTDLLQDGSGMEDFKGTLEVRRSVFPNENVVLKGEDVIEGAVAMKAGTFLRPQEIGFLAALGLSQVKVIRRPSVAIFSSGDEVLPVESTVRPGQVRDVNSHALAALMSDFDTKLCGIIPDSETALENALNGALLEHDAIFLSGGSSMGARDLTIDAIKHLPDVEILAHGLALSPGKPLILARARRPNGGICSIWGLPGQVASVQVVTFVLGLPFLRYISGCSDAFNQKLWPSRRAVLSRDTPSSQGREDYIRVHLEYYDNSYDSAPSAIPVTGKSGLLRTMLEADGVVRIPANSEGLRMDEDVEVLMF